MNTNLMDILVGETRGIASSDDGGGVDDILGPRPRPRPGDNGDDVRRREQQQQQQLRGTTNYFGLNLGRSQSAAPETWEYAKFPPASARSAEGMGGDGGGLFGGGGGGGSGRGGHHRGFFDEEEEDREHAIMLQKLASRRPASTGVIGQRPGASDVGGGGGSSSSGDVDSILETLGFTSLELSGKQRPPPSSLGGIGDPTPAGPSSFVLGGAHLEKINEQRQGQNEGANYFAMTGHQRGETPSRSGNLLFVNNQGGGGGGGQMGLQGNVGPTSASSTMSAQQCQLEQMQPPPGLSEQGQGGGYFGQQQQQQQVHASQYVLQQPSSHVRQVHHQDQLPFDSQQQQQQLYYSQDYRAQQQASMNMMHGGAVLQINPGQQQTIYHINAPSVSPYGFDYQTPQHPHLHQHVVPANHILLPQHQQISGGGGGSTYHSCRSRPRSSAGVRRDTATGRLRRTPTSSTETGPTRRRLSPRRRWGWEEGGGTRSDDDLRHGPQRSHRGIVIGRTPRTGADQRRELRRWGTSSRHVPPRRGRDAQPHPHGWHQRRRWGGCD